ncbi:MAG: OmpH family outer membrane protein [Terriglobia bacterium]
MKNTAFKLAALAWIVTMPALLLAQNNNGDAPTRVGIINLQQAVGATNEGKQALESLQKKYAPRSQGLQQQDKEISALQDQLQNQSSMLSDQERYNIERELSEKQRHFKEAQNDYQYDSQADEQDVVRTIGQKMLKVIHEYAQQHHFALVIGAGEQQTPVYYAAKTVNITQDIVNLYNTTYPAASASSTAGSSAVSASRKAPAKPRK